MLAVLIVIAALMKIDFIQAYPKASKDADIYAMFFDQVLPDEEFGTPSTEPQYERTTKSLIEFRKKLLMNRNDIGDKRDEVRKRCPDEEIDVVDRADHITQFLADMFVNTDNEITILQAVEPEESYLPNENEEAFFDFLSNRANDNSNMDRPSDELTR